MPTNADVIIEAKRAMPEGEESKTRNVKAKTAVQPTHAEMKAIADKVAATPYDEAVEGILPFYPYDGLDNFEAKPVQLGGPKEHSAHMPRRERPTNTIASSALEFVNNTPLIRVDRLRDALKLPEKIELLTKCEMYNAGGSVKDRIAMRMIEEAEASGQIKPGDVLIEPTSGNTGCGLCMAAAIKGYKVIITMPLKMSGEKLNMMKGLGAEIYRTPTEAGWRDTNSHIALAIRLQKAIPCAHVLDQYKNMGNPMAHYDWTGAEIVDQCGGKLDYMVISAGTGGTITGIAKKLKEKIPGVKVIGVDPQGSILALPDSLNDEDRLKAYAVEGIGYDFIPSVLDRSVADVWVKTKDTESFKMARTIIKREGIMCGGSCGSAMAGAVKAIEQLGITEGRVCVLLADSTRNYMSKFLDDAWMEKNGFPLDTF